MKQRYALITTMLALFVLVSCSMEDLMRRVVKAPPSSIERDVKGHEQIFSVQAILRLAHRRPDRLIDNAPTYTAYDITSVSTPIPIFQEISFSKDFNGKMTITSQRKAFDVVKGKDIYYALELKYYDLNGQLINHQFSSYDLEDVENSTLAVHQHFFSIQNYALGGHPLVYPMTLDSVYIDRYLFQVDNAGSREVANSNSSSIVYAPEQYQSNSLRYNLKLALKASEAALTSKAQELHKDEQRGETYRFYKTIDAFKLNELVPEIFTYEYRDTDPVEEPLGKILTGLDDLKRQRVGTPVTRLRKERSLPNYIKIPPRASDRVQGGHKTEPRAHQPYDALGFKGVLQFKQANVVFQMRTCISHILTAAGKYDLLHKQFTNPGGVHHHNEISPAWNNFDIDYPIPFRVIADVDSDQDACIQDIQRFYPNADRADLVNMLWGNTFFARIPFIMM